MRVISTNTSVTFMPWIYVGGIRPDHFAACLSDLLNAESQREEIEPGTTFWTWELDKGKVQVRAFFSNPPGLFEVVTMDEVLGRQDEDWSDLDFAELVVDRCAGAFALTDDKQYCDPHAPEFVRVTKKRLEVVSLRDDEESGEEVIDESLTKLICER